MKLGSGASYFPKIMAVILFELMMSDYGLRLTYENVIIWDSCFASMYIVTLPAWVGTKPSSDFGIENATTGRGE